MLLATGRAHEGYAALEQALEVARTHYRQGPGRLTVPYTAYMDRGPRRL